MRVMTEVTTGDAHALRRDRAGDLQGANGLDDQQQQRRLLTCGERFQRALGRGDGEADASYDVSARRCDPDRHRARVVSVGGLCQETLLDHGCNGIHGRGLGYAEMIGNGAYAHTLLVAASDVSEHMRLRGIETDRFRHGPLVRPHGGAYAVKSVCEAPNQTSIKFNKFGA